MYSNGGWNTAVDANFGLTVNPNGFSFAPLVGFTMPGYLLERPTVETFYDYNFDWTSKTHTVEDTRLTLSYQFVGNAHDLYGEVPVVELVDARVPVVEQVASIGWVSQAITEQQTVVKPTRVMVSAPAVDYAVFSGDSLKANNTMTIDAGRDVSLSGLVAAKNAAGTSGSITVNAGRDFFMTGAKPTGAAANSLAATAGMTAVNNITITTGGSFTLAESINIKADDGNSLSSTVNKIVVTTGESAIIRGTLETTNTRFGENTVNAGDEIELKGEIVSGHLVNIFAGTDGYGGITSDIQGRIKTLGSEVHMKAGALGGDIALTDLFIDTAGPLELLAAAGKITNDNGLLTAGKLSAIAKDGASLGYVQVGALEAEVTGTGSISLYGFGTMKLDKLITANGAIDAKGTGDVIVGNVTAGGANNTADVKSLTGRTSYSGIVKSSTPVTMTAEGGQTIEVEASELHLTVTTPGNVTVKHIGTGPFTIYATVLNGELTVETDGDLHVADVQMLSNNTVSGFHAIAGGDVCIERINAGDYAATAEEAAALRTARGLAADARFTSLGNVSIQAGGAIREIGAGDAAVDIVADTVTLEASTGINGLELAVNEVTKATTTTGSISLSDTEGVGELSTGLDVIQATATAGTVTINAGGSLLVGAVTAGATGNALNLTAQTGSFDLQAHGSVAAALTSAGKIAVTAALEARLAGSISATGGLTIDAQSEVTVNSAIAARGVVTIVSQQSSVKLGADIQAQQGGSISELSLTAAKDLVVTGRVLPSVTTKMTLTAGEELITSLTQPALVVTGANGELNVTAGGDLAILTSTLVKADRVTLASTGYTDQGGTVHGGYLTMINAPQGVSAATPQTLSLTAARGLQLHQDVTASVKLKLAGGEVTLSREGMLRYYNDLIYMNGINHATVQAALQGTVSILTAPTIEIAGGTTLKLDQGTTYADKIVSANPVILTSGNVTIDIATGAKEDGAVTANTGHTTASFTGAGGLTKRGAGTLELPGTSTFTGPLKVEGGTLLVTGSTVAASAVTVTNATLGGNGTINGSVTIGSGGHLMVGTEPKQIATLRTGALTFQAGAELELDISPTQKDQLLVTGAISIGANTAVKVTGLNGFVPPVGYNSYTLIVNDTNTDAITGSFQSATIRNDLDAVLSAGLIYNGGDSNDIALITNADPILDSLTVDSVYENGVAHLRGTYHDPGDAGPHQLTINWGEGAIQTVTVSGGSFDLTHQYLDDALTSNPTDDYAISVKLSDSLNAFTTGSATARISNVAPTALFGNGGAVNEGSSGSVSFANLFDPSTLDTAAGFRVAYDFDNNGVFDSGDGTYAGSGTALSATVLASYFADGNGTRTVKGRIIDKDGGYTDYTTNITVNNVAPTPCINGVPTNPPQGFAITLGGSATDPSPTDTLVGFSLAWTVTGPGGYSRTGSGPSFSFTPNQAGSYQVTLKATDKDNGYNTTTTSINVQPTRLALVPAGANFTAGVAQQVTVQLQDTNGNAVVAGAGGLTVQLTTTSTAGSFLPAGGGAAITTVTIAAGQSSAIVQYRDTKAAAPTLTATDISGALTTPLVITRSVLINPAAPSQLYTSSVIANANAGSTLSSLSIQLRDQYGNDVKQVLPNWLEPAHRIMLPAAVQLDCMDKTRLAC